MPRPPRTFSAGLLYHAIVRGNQRRATFLDDDDYQSYLRCLAAYRRRDEVVLYAYCLMPNHVHLLVRTAETPLSKFMQSLQQSYTQRFNARHGTVGHVFQGRYRAIICETDEYLAALVRYIHLNPVRADLVPDPGRYAYSSHRIYADGMATALLDPSPVLRMLGGRRAYRAFVAEAIGHGHDPRFYDVDRHHVLRAGIGAPEAVQRVAETDGGRLERWGSGIEAEAPAIRHLLDDLTVVAARIGIDLESLCGRRRSRALRKARALVCTVLVRRCRYRICDVAAAFGRDATSTARLVSKMTDQLRTSTLLTAEFDRLAQGIAIHDPGARLQV